MTVPQPAPPQGEGRPPWLRVATSEKDVQELAALILDPNREQPVVCLTSRQGESNPALDPWEAREVVGEEQPMWFVPDGPLTRDLERRLPPKLQVYGGAARIWWSGVTEQSHPHDHPLVQDPYAVYGSQTLRTFGQRFARGASDAPAQIRGPAEVLLRQERDRLRRRVDGLAEDLRQAKTARDSACKRATKAERELRAERQKAKEKGPAPEPSSGAGGQDDEADFHRLLLGQWLAKLSPADRANHPLGPYVLGRVFLKSVRELELAPPEPVAEVCALVACGRAPEIGGLDLHPLRTGPGGGNPQRVRGSDGAKAMRCALRRCTPAAPRLHYWERKDRVVEFAKVGGHEDLEIPEATRAA